MATIVSIQDPDAARYERLRDQQQKGFFGRRRTTEEICDQAVESLYGELNGCHLNKLLEGSRKPRTITDLKKEYRGLEDRLTNALIKFQSHGFWPPMGDGTGSWPTPTKEDEEQYAAVKYEFKDSYGYSSAESKTVMDMKKAHVDILEKLWSEYYRWMDDVMSETSSNLKPWGGYPSYWTPEMDKIFKQQHALLFEWKVNNSIKYDLTQIHKEFNARTSDNIIEELKQKSQTDLTKARLLAMREEKVKWVKEQHKLALTKLR